MDKKKKNKKEEKYTDKDLPVTDEELPEKDVKEEDFPDEGEEEFFEYIEEKDGD